MLKQKELEEYLAVHYKGQIPPHVTQKVRTQKKELADAQWELDDRKRKLDSGKIPVSDARTDFRAQRGDEKPPRDSLGRGRERSQLDDFPLSDDEDLGPRQRPRVGGKIGRVSDRGRDRDFNDDVRQTEQDDAEDEPLTARGPRGGRVADRSGHAKESAEKHKQWVSQAEYDELSALCDSLLKQQDDLQADLDRARSGKTMPSNAKRPVVKGVGLDGRVQPRAKSQQQVHRERETSAVPVPVGRPKSIQSTGRRVAEPNTARSAGGGASASGAKVAFGRVIKETQSRVEPVVPAVSQQKKLLKAGGAATGRMLKDVGNIDASSGYNSPPLAPRGGPAKGQGGFGALAAKARGGPVVVSYEDDLGGSTAGQRGPRSGKGGGNRQSAELDGNSEYLRIGGEEVDLISGDQLDRLLVNARRTRGGH